MTQNRPPYGTTTDDEIENRPPYRDDSADLLRGLILEEPPVLADETGEIDPETLAMGDVEIQFEDRDAGPRALTHDDRADVVAYASHLTLKRQDPHAVAAAARPLFDWLAESEDEDDACARLAALRQQHRNDSWSRKEEGDDSLASLGTGYGPEEFIANARVLHALILGSER